MVLVRLSRRVTCPNHASFRLFDSCQKRFLWTNKKADLASHPVVGLELQVRDVVSQLVSWRFKSSKPQRTISGLKETLIKRYVVERTDKAR